MKNNTKLMAISAFTMGVMLMMPMLASANDSRENERKVVKNSPIGTSVSNKSDDDSEIEENENEHSQRPIFCTVAIATSTKKVSQNWF